MRMRRIIPITAGVITAILVAILLPACNYEAIDLNYTFDYAIINLGGEYKKIAISSWRDYEDGEQIQITDKQGNVYLTNSFNCTLVKGE